MTTKLKKVLVFKRIYTLWELKNIGINPVQTEIKQNKLR